MNKKYVVYLTTYLGDKLPKYYIGSTSENNIILGKYFGSVRSKKYRKIFEDELKNNLNLFCVDILSYHETRIDALKKELKEQIERDVINSIEYFNESYATINGFFGRDVSGKINPMFNRKNEVIAIDENGNKIRIKKDIFEKNNNLSGHTAGFIFVKNKTTNKLVKIEKGEFSKNRDKYIHPNEGIKHSDKTKKILSEQRKNMCTVKDLDGNYYRVNKNDNRIKSGELINIASVVWIVVDNNGNEYKTSNIKKFLKFQGIIFSEKFRNEYGEIIKNHNPYKGKSLNGWKLNRLTKIKKYEKRN